MINLTRSAVWRSASGWMLVALVLSFPGDAVSAGDNARPSLDRRLPNLHIPFIANAGQVDDGVRFYAPTIGGTVFVTARGEIVYGLVDTDRTSTVALTERLLRARPAAVTGLEKAQTAVSFLKGEKSEWRSGVPTYNMLSLGRMYDGIELRLKARASSVEKLFYLDPFARPADIRIAIEGASSLAITDRGELEARTARGPVSFTRPIAFQEHDGIRRDVDVKYVIHADGYGFEVGSYDRSRPLVIDPTLASTFIGGSGNEYVNTFGFGGNGDLYVAGTTTSTNLPGGATYKGGANDLFVARLDPELTTLVALAYVGGAAEEDHRGMAIDSNGNVFVAGMTRSSNIPVTPGAYDLSRDTSQSATGADLFVAKLDENLTTVLAATYIGGSREDAWCCGGSLLIDADDNIFTVILTVSTNYPTTVGAYDRTYNDIISTNTDDIVISKFSNGLNTLLASTYLGGGLWDVPYGATLDAAGNIYVVGRTSSGTPAWGPPFPTTPGAYHGDYADGWTALGTYYDGFISKLSNNLGTLIASTYLGSTSDLDLLWDIAVAPDNSVYVVGSTISNAFPVTAGAFDTSFNNAPNTGVEDGFVTHMNSTLTGVLQSTYFGGSAFDRPIGISLDSSGGVNVGGLTKSSNFPSTAGAFQPVYHPGGASGYDGFYARLNATLSTLQYSTFVGGSNDDVLYRPRLDPNGALYLHGQTLSADFPTSAGAADGTHNGGTDAFVLRLPTTDVAITKEASDSAVVAGGSLTYTLTVTNNGPGSASGISVVDALPAGVTFDAAWPSQGTCSGTSTITCALGSLAESASATVEITVTANAVGSVANTAGFSSSAFDTNTSNNESSVTVEVLADGDGDGVADASDNCPGDGNADQADADGDGIGDVCDADDNDGPLGDLDGDGVINDLDDDDTDGPLGDSDGDGDLNNADNCVATPNPDQRDTDADGLGDVCDADDDGDGVSDADEIAAGSDPLNAASTPEVCDGADNDLDGATDEVFPDTDGDGQANCIDADDDNDAVSDAEEMAAGSNPFNPASTPEICDGADNDLDGATDEGFPNLDGDALADCADPDDDNDGVVDTGDNCPAIGNGDQADVDGDGLGDACDDTNNGGSTTVVGPLSPFGTSPGVFNAGRTIPLKWQYADSHGQIVESSSFAPIVLLWRVATCGATTGGTSVDVATSGNSGYQYHAQTSTWQFNWSTKGLATGCYYIQIASAAATSSSFPLQLR